ncbi:aminotransferase class III-fold pyridoxal phosphate-dependent enzyme [Brevibacterium sp. 91QC2O2]|uniref:aspartate aminotransferase family protein n=1 Tax=Brevibacterium sp. 91QC2O2 TaxID=2968458 RepID=UPI00211B7C8F|nr:aminotransferase class III-fold pyridoxal phosphate-dependent enzyme [Brevibacterium sp. 91QC2O2]MCQ9368536.1 aminotransferase class III-fold pyridoxal phosphate-dependent enzyme [Brevibacterium sp. 91QC2O2]
MSREANLRQGSSPEDSELIRRRNAVLSDSYRLFYEHPVELVRGQGARLYDTAGREYIDMYNNVPSIGHSHPLVTEYVSRQLSTLSTHTRYITPVVVDYSEALLAEFPPALDRVTYACTGSEAVDLAVRMARYYTGNRGIIVTSHAYHGTTTASAELSPSLGDGNALSPFVELVELPDTAVSAASPAEASAAFAAAVESAAVRLQEMGAGLAAVLIDSIMSSDGVRPDPLGLLPAAAAVAHRYGGLYIADEVQPGFGRTGTMWGFARHPAEVGSDDTAGAADTAGTVGTGAAATSAGGGAGAESFVPDIVVLGKPMGNGMPISAVVHRREVGRKFGQNVRYFNTFGGNPVSIAAARAVLEVIRSEDLPAHALRLGDRLADDLSRLTADRTLNMSAGAERGGASDAQSPAAGATSGAAVGAMPTAAGAAYGADPRFAPVRHAGLFLGLDVLDESGAPDPASANRLVNELREAGVLISASGQAGNTLKVRPPLAITEPDVDRFLDIFATLLP